VKRRTKPGWVSELAKKRIKKLLLMAEVYMRRTPGDLKDI
jgi:hypothetical protein